MPLASPVSTPAPAFRLRAAGWLPILSLLAAVASAAASSTAPATAPASASETASETAAASGTSLQAPAPAALPDTAAPVGTSAALGDSTSWAASQAGLESNLQGRKIVLDWTVTEATPARFSISHPDGRVIATRDGRRSVQGWIASVRVAGWPRGMYLVTAEAGASKSARKFILR